MNILIAASLEKALDFPPISFEEYQQVEGEFEARFGALRKQYAQYGLTIGEWYHLYDPIEFLDKVSGRRIQGKALSPNLRWDVRN